MNTKTKIKPAFVGSFTQLGDGDLSGVVGGGKASGKAPKPAPEKYVQVTLETPFVSSYSY